MVSISNALVSSYLCHHHSQKALLPSNHTEWQTSCCASSWGSLWPTPTGAVSELEDTRNPPIVPDALRTDNGAGTPRRSTDREGPRFW